MSIEERVEQALDEIRPRLQADGGDVELVEVRGDVAVVRLQGACAGCPSAKATLRGLIEKAVRERCPEIRSVEQTGEHAGHTHSDHAHPPLEEPQGPARLPGVQRVIVVASGKGGVGKSTVAVNLALALRRRLGRVGLLDADLYGPSLPTLLGVQEPPRGDGEGVLPVSMHGLELMSIGFFIDPAAPVIWRGPMVNRALQQFLGEVHWGALDALVVDLPPGTGDAQLTLVQNLDIDGAVIVTTPSDVALADVRRAVGMFQQVGVRVLGVVENMSGFVCPHCGQATDVFSRGGGRAVAEELGADFLGEIPLDPAIRQGGDQGQPVVLAAPESAQARVFEDLAERVLERLPPETLRACGA